jgi:chorismate mutase
VGANEAEDILAATRVLLDEMVAANGIRVDDIGAAFFTMTSDLDAAFPARAAREMGWEHVPLIDSQEIPVPGSLVGCIRVLLLWNTDAAPSDITHVYQGDAVRLRPDLVRSTADEEER